METIEKDSFVTSPETDKVYGAIFKLQGKIWNVPRDKRNQHKGYDYTTLEALNDWLRPILQECGLIVIQPPHSSFNPDPIGVEKRVKQEGQQQKEVQGTVTTPVSTTTRIVHAPSGQFIQATNTFIPEPMAGSQMVHAAGASISYYRRYQLMGMLGIVGDNDLDGLPAPLNDKSGQQQDAGKKSDPEKEPDKKPDDSKPQTDPAADQKSKVKEYMKNGLTKEGLSAIAGQLFEAGAVSANDSKKYTVADWNTLLEAIAEAMK